MTEQLGLFAGAVERRQHPRPPYIYRWDRQGRKGQPCWVLARGTMNSCLVEFEDNYRMVTSRNAIMKRKD
jgi:hypothetical protein